MFWHLPLVLSAIIAAETSGAFSPCEPSAAFTEALAACTSEKSHEPIIAAAYGRFAVATANLSAVLDQRRERSGLVNSKRNTVKRLYVSHVSHPCNDLNNNALFQQRGEMISRLLGVHN